MCINYLIFCFVAADRSRDAFTFHEHALSVSTEERNEVGIARARMALQSLARGMVDITRMSVIGKPFDFDALAFWAHGTVAKAALWHIRLRERSGEWQDCLAVLKTYLRWVAPRFKIYGTYHLLF